MNQDALEKAANLILNVCCQAAIVDAESRLDMRDEIKTALRLVVDEAVEQGRKPRMIRPRPEIARQWRLIDKTDPTKGDGAPYFEIYSGDHYYDSKTGTGFSLCGFISPQDAQLIVSAPELLRQLEALAVQLNSSGLVVPPAVQDAIDQAKQAAA